ILLGWCPGTGALTVAQTTGSASDRHPFPRRQRSGPTAAGLGEAVDPPAFVRAVYVAPYGSAPPFDPFGCSRYADLTKPCGGLETIRRGGTRRRENIGKTCRRSAACSFP